MFERGTLSHFAFSKTTAPSEREPSNLSVILTDDSSPKRGADKPLLLGEVSDRRSDGERKIKSKSKISTPSVILPKCKTTAPLEREPSNLSVILTDDSSPKRGTDKPLLLGEVADRRSDGEVSTNPLFYFNVNLCANSIKIGVNIII